MTDLKKNADALRERVLAADGVTVAFGRNPATGTGNQITLRFGPLDTMAVLEWDWLVNWCHEDFLAVLDLVFGRADD